VNVTRYLFLICAALTLNIAAQATETWSDGEVATIKKLWIGSLPALPKSMGNAFADDPRAAALGKRLFFDKALSENGEVACSTCHDPAKSFTDGNALAEGRGTAPRNSPSVVGAAYHRFQFWDGRADSLWAQALGPFESSAEHGTNRMFIARSVFSTYRTEYEAIFGKLPNLSDTARFPGPRAPIEEPEVRATWDAMAEDSQQIVLKIFVNVGKSIEAYERHLKPGISPFDRYAEALLESGDPEALRGLSDEAQQGLKLFIGKAGCVQCHNGPLLSDDGFHNTGIPANLDVGKSDPGRVVGLLRLLNSGFNCLSPFSDTPKQDLAKTCASLLELQTSTAGFKTSGDNTATLEFEENDALNDLADASNGGGRVEVSPLLGAFKTPSLRNVALTAPYMHAGQYANLSQVLSHYVNAPDTTMGTSELKPAPLDARETAALIAFLKSLSAPVVETPTSLQTLPSSTK
jgi:cytochrome c peroxidase